MSADPHTPTPTTPMERALALAAQAAARGEVPVGCVILGPDGTILAEAHNRTETDRDPTAHAELLAIRAAARALGSPRLVGCALYVTLEPCAMCAGAIIHARLARVLYGASDPKGGAVEHGPRLFDQPSCLHRPELHGGLAARDSAALLRGFFATLRG